MLNKLIDILSSYDITILGLPPAKNTSAKNNCLETFWQVHGMSYFNEKVR